MNNIESVTLRGYAGYMLRVRLKKIQGMNPILACITSLPVLFCNRKVSIPCNIKDTEVGKTLYNNLEEYNKKIAKRNVLSVDSSNLSFAQILNHKSSKYTTIFPSPLSPSAVCNVTTDSSRKENNEITLIEDDVVSVLKNTNKDLCDNIDLISL